MSVKVEKVYYQWYYENISDNNLILNDLTKSIQNSL